MDNVLAGASLYDDWRCKGMADNEGTVLAVQREKKVTPKITHTKNARDGEFLHLPDPICYGRQGIT